jgi:hypothetical protein
VTSYAASETLASAEFADPAEQDLDDRDDLAMTAYRVTGRSFDVVPAALRRAWMDETDARFANRCLPMLMANQAGWWVPNPRSFTARWDGGNTPLSLRMEYDGGPAPYPATSHFGHGIVTFHIPLLVRTPPGWNLLVRGPANQPKDGAAPLEGLVETDWAVATFTMNWKLTRPGLEVQFARGEPICMLVPQRRGELERFRPVFAPVERMPDGDGYRAWQDSRSGFLQDQRGKRDDEAAKLWQRDYMLGTDPGEASGQDGFADHQRRLTLREFADPEPPAPSRRCAPPAASAAAELPDRTARDGVSACPYA